VAHTSEEHVSLQELDEAVEKYVALARACFAASQGQT
jgi:hypothetical protein